ncbi:MAG: Amuc_1098 family type IV pilus outer membrane protein [Verrucomicrobiota bacterium]
MTVRPIYSLAIAISGFVLLSGGPMVESANAGEGAYSSSYSSLPDIAQREIARRQEKMVEAHSLVEEGDRLASEQDFEGAIREYQTALNGLPRAPITDAMRAQLIQRYTDASVELAKQRIDEGRFDEAIALLEAVLAPDMAPNHRGARTLLKHLEDPDYYNMALTPEHVARVQRVQQALRLADGAYRLGDYDKARDYYYEVLNIDKYNVAARKGLERNANEKIHYYNAAYDQTRASFLEQVDAAWESKVPAIGIEQYLDDNVRATTGGESGQAYINNKLRSIIIPRIEFADTPLEDAVEFLRQKAAELDTGEADPARKGVDIIIRQGSSGGGLGGDDATGLGGLGAGGGSSPRITLALSNVPLAEALRYATELAGMKYKVETHAVVIVPRTESTEELFLKSFKVPPTFLSAGGDGGGGGAVVDDPFADPVASSGGGTIERRRTAQEVLEGAGVSFPPGASAFYNEVSSQLTVRNTQSQMELVEAYVDSITSELPKQIFITSKFLEIAQTNYDEFGFDVLLGAFNVGGDRAFGAGGTVGDTRLGLNPDDFTFVPPNSTVPVGQNIVTSGLRSGLNAIDTNSIDNLLDDGPEPTSNLAPGVFSLAGVFTDPQFQIMLRAVSQHKGTDLLSAPSVTTRSGQRAKIEVIREFIYPTEYDPPELPDRVGVATIDTDGVGTTGGLFPVTPANPTAFETRNTGVTLEVDPQIGPDGFTIDLNLVPEVVEFDGFINYGSPITTGTGTGVITENRIEMPVFSTRKVTTSVTIWDGQTVAIGGLIREDVQDVEDKVPVVGDLPIVGRLFQSSVETRAKRNLTVFVTARIIDPAGQNIRNFEPTTGGGGAASGGGGGAVGMGGSGNTIGTNPLFPQ